MSGRIDSGRRCASASGSLPFGYGWILDGGSDKAVRRGWVGVDVTPAWWRARGRMRRQRSAMDTGLGKVGGRDRASRRGEAQQA